MRTKIPFICSFNKIIRTLTIRAISLVTGRIKGEHADFHKNKVEKILLVRTTRRMGSSILATPAIFLFRRNFPHARIDFIGNPTSRVLFKNLPINNHFSINNHFPNFLIDCLSLLNKIRSVNYDLAVDVSCSQSAMGSFIIGFSGARLRVGLQGKWDHWFNVRIPRPAEINKYRVLPKLIGAMGLETQEIFPRLILSATEKAEGKKKIETITGGNCKDVVGVFIGGRKLKGKRWSMENFIHLIKALRTQGIKVVVFFGPEEKKSMESFGQTLTEVRLRKTVPLVFEPSAMCFASMVSNCTLFISCDSGPMHLACALGVRTIAIFQKSDFKRWGPPAKITHIIYKPEGVSVEEVLNVSLEELHNLSSSQKDSHL